MRTSLGFSGLEMHALGEKVIEVVQGKSELYLELDGIMKCQSRIILRKCPTRRDSLINND